jgi:peptidoglycan/LPS O-acetylase OafA/YrhL
MPGDHGDHAAPPVRHQRLAHRPALDGLRGLAVAAVVVYHLRPGLLPGGFVGVDIFFVLSGFLITSLLLAEAAAEGSVHLRRFVVRRVRRLAPALLLVIAAMAVYGAAWANPFELRRLRVHGVWALLSLANWRFIADGVTYTDVVVGASPLRHVWSLSIEEQFYVVLPLAVLLAARLAGRHVRAAVLGGALALTATSAVTAAVLNVRGSSIARTYFGTDTRAQALLVGVALGAWLSGRPVASHRRRVAGAGALVGAVGLSVFAFTVHEQTSLLPRGGFLFAAVAAALVIAGAEHLAPLATLLTSRPLVALGLISYGVYLWHWPIIVVVDARRTGLRAGSPGLVVLQLALTLLCALASYWLVERPIRAGVLGRTLGRAAVGVWPVATAAVVMALVIATAPPDTGSASTPSTDTLTTLPSTDPTPGSNDTSVPGGGPHLVMLGDSVAHSLAGGQVLDFPDVAEWQPEQATIDDMVSVAKPGCSFLAGEVSYDGGATSADTTKFCGDWRADVAAAMDRERPAHLVLLLVIDLGDRVVDGRVVRFGSPEFQVLLDHLLDELDALAADHGGDLVLLAPAPRAPEFTDTMIGERAPELLRMLTDYGERRGVTVISLADAPTTDRFDGTHYAWNEAREVLTWVAAQLPS